MLLATPAARPLIRTRPHNWTHSPWPGVSGSGPRPPPAPPLSGPLADLLSHARGGDALVVWRLDRLGRSCPHLIGLLADLEQRQVQFRSLTEALDTSTAGGRLVFNIFASIAEF